MLYRKRPDLVEAQQWWPTGHCKHVHIDSIRREDPELPGRDGYSGWPACGWMLDCEGLWFKVFAGDWIIVEPNGTRNVLPDSTFKLCYDPV